MNTVIPLGFGSIGAQELILILLIVVLLFGARKIPDLARGLGEGIRNFRSAMKEPPADRDKKDKDKEDRPGEPDR